MTALVSLRSLINARTAEQTGNGNERIASELFVAHEAEVSAARAMLLAPSTSHLTQMRNAHFDFQDQLASLLERVADPDIHDLALQVQATEQAYYSALARAVRKGRRSGWVLGNIARPLRTRLESNLRTLARLIQNRADAAGRKQAHAARVILHEIVALAVATGILLIGVGILIAGTLRSERESVVRALDSENNFKSGERRAALLAQTGRLLSEGQPPEQTLKAIADLVVKWLANLCLIELTEESDHDLRSTAIAFMNTGRDSLFEHLYRTLPSGLGSLFETNDILKSSRSSLQKTVTDERLKGLGINSFAVILLRARGRTLGILVLARMNGEPPYNDEDFRFCQELGVQMGLAIDNARLLHQAEAGLKMREELLGTVAHDLKNPLTSIRLNCEVLARESDKAQPPKNTSS